MRLTALRQRIMQIKLSGATDQASALAEVRGEQKEAMLKQQVTELQAKIPDRTSEVALLERSLAVENAKLAQLPKHSQAYDAQKTIMEAVEKRIIFGHPTAVKRRTSRNTTTYKF